MKYQQVLVILNPISGIARISVKKIISAALQEYGCNYEFAMTNSRDNYDDVVFGKFDLALICGGDGTVNAIISYLVAHNFKLPVGIIPLGSANLLANYLGVPILTNRAVKYALSHEPLPFDVMQVNQKYYSLVALGIGYDALVMRLTARGLKRIFGFGAYIIGMVQGLFHLKEYNFSLLMDGERINRHAKTVFVMNIGRFLGIKFGPNIYHSDGLINVGIVRPVSIFDVFRLFLGLISKKYFIKNRLEYFPCKRLEIIFNKRVPAQIDGELVDLGDRVNIRVLPGAIKIAGKV